MREREKRAGVRVQDKEKRKEKEEREVDADVLKVEKKGGGSEKILLGCLLELQSFRRAPRRRLSGFSFFQK